MRRDEPYAVTRRGLLVGASVLPLAAAPASLVSAQGRATSTGGYAYGEVFEGRWPIRPMLKANLAHLLDEKGRAKFVHARRVLDDMETDGGWVSSDAVTLGYTTDRARTGRRSLRFSTLLRNEKYIAASRRKNGSFAGSGVLFEGQPFAAFARRRFAAAQDWSDYNRISLWCYVHPTTNPINTVSIQFICQGAAAGPMNPISVHYIADLKPGEWNHLVWEIPEFPRDKVTDFVIFQTLSGLSVAGTDPGITYDFDELAVERVDAEPPVGWAIADGTLAYSHIGYQPHAPKIAVAPEGPDRFELLDAAGGVAGSFAAPRAASNRGRYRRLDFTAFAKPGTYRLRHGDANSEPFVIGEQVWEPVIEATLNAFYGLRCGFPVPGVHDACHRDVFSVYKGERRSVEGGWHDAANMTQSPYRTHLSIYALVELHDALARAGRQTLAARALEEALWGLDWSERTRFGPGLRTLYMDASYWTDSQVGTIDDVVQDDPRADVGIDGFQNTLGVLAAARAARALKLSDPGMARRLLLSAREDFATVLPALQPPADATPLEINEPSWRDRIAYATLAAVELFRATRIESYGIEAARLAQMLIATQERSFVDGIRIAGYFYEDAGRTRIVHEYHNSFEDGGLLAFAALCEALPDHPEWMDWYAGLSIYADHFCAAGATASAPFDIIPAAVWRRSDLDAPQPLDRTGAMLASKPSPVFPTPPTPEMIRAQMSSEYEAGTPLGPNHRLRVFPLWYDHVRKGATTVHMSKTIGLGAAAATLNRPLLSDLAGRQLQWTLGANPFSRSLLYGVGNAFWQNFSVALPNLVGGMSLGFNSYVDDAPAWGNNAVFPYKEMWVYSSCRIALNLSRVGIGGWIAGDAPVGAVFRHVTTGAERRMPAGRYAASLPAGQYVISFGGRERRLALADGANLSLNLDPASTIALTAHVRKAGPRTWDVTLTAAGAGVHRLLARSWNLEPVRFDAVVDFSQGVVERSFRVVQADADRPWILRLGTRSEDGMVEITGTADAASVASGV